MKYLSLLSVLSVAMASSTEYGAHDPVPRRGPTKWPNPVKKMQPEIGDWGDLGKGTIQYLGVWKDSAKRSGR